MEGLRVFYFVLYVVGALCFLGAAIAAVIPPREGRVHLSGALIPFGLFCWLLPTVIEVGRTLG